MMASVASISCAPLTARGLASPAPGRARAVVVRAENKAVDAVAIPTTRRGAMLAAGAAITTLIPKEARAASFLDGINPLRAPMTEAPPEFAPDTLHLIKTMRGMDDGSAIDVEGFRAEGDGWVEKYKFNHFGKDNAYYATFKAFLAIKAACNEANGNPLKGNFTAVEFDPAKVEYKRDVIRRFMTDAEGYLEGSKTGAPSL